MQPFGRLFFAIFIFFLCSGYLVRQTGLNTPERLAIRLRQIREPMHFEDEQTSNGQA